MKYVLAIMLVAIMLLSVGALTNTSEVTAVAEPAMAEPTEGCTTVATVTVHPLSTWRIVQFEHSNALFIVTSDGTCTPYYKADGTLMTLEDMKSD